MRSGSREQRINKAVMEKYGGVCHVCGHPGADQVDHVIPLAEGGPDTFANRRPIHSKPCHAAKTAEERERGRRRAAA
jgi:5-methylcytosine-specific restriction endonuclease McrA